MIVYNKDDVKKNENNIFNDINNIIKDYKNKDKKAEYQFKIESLCPMNNNRSNHSMIQLSSNKNILFCVGGINTENCEVYNIEFDSWESISDLPVAFQNPGIIDINSFIYVFPYSDEFNNIYKLDMNNQDLVWESIKYSIDEGKIRKGTLVISIEDNIYLLGGYDNENTYDSIYQVLLNNEEQIDIKLSPDFILSNKCHFNSNYIIINNINSINENENKIDNEDKNDENNNNIPNNNNRILIMDNNNGVIEFDWSLGKFYCYLE